MSEERIDQLVAGRYRLKRLLGEGGMGAVYEALQEPLGRPVALKLLHASLASDQGIVARFKREAELAASLAHPNIVQATDFGQTEAGEPFLVMDRISGSALSDVITQEGRLDAGRVAFVADQVLAALEAAHAAGVIHRDLKPENVFLTSVSGVHDVVKVLDFGIAALSSDGLRSRLTQTGQVLGTPAYMSPEQAMGSPIDGRSDLYAVGVILYEALAGRLPFERETYNALLFAIVTDEPERLDALRPDVDPGLVAVIHKAMAKDPGERFSSANEMRLALEPYVRVWRQGATPAPSPTGPTIARPLTGSGVRVSNGTPPGGRFALSTEAKLHGQSAATVDTLDVRATSVMPSDRTGSRSLPWAVLGVATLVVFAGLGIVAWRALSATAAGVLSAVPEVASAADASVAGPLTNTVPAVPSVDVDAPLPLSRLSAAPKGEWVEIAAPGMVGTFADFDPIANASWVVRVAQAWSMDARLERLGLSGVRPDGHLDLSARDDFDADYRFRSPALEEAGRAAMQVSEVKVYSRFRVWVGEGAVRVMIGEETHFGGKHPPEALELRCRVDAMMEQWREASLAQRPYYDIDVYFRGGRYRWGIDAHGNAEGFGAPDIDPETCSRM